MLPGIQHNGYLRLILGPMFAGKTSALITYSRKYELAGYKCALINHSSDDRFVDGTGTARLGSHCGDTVPCVRADRLGNLSDQDSAIVRESEVILINEAQFFEDVVGWVLHQVEKNGKIVFVSGLDGDYRRERFGTLIDLIPYADDVEKLKALCLICRRREAPFSLRLSSNSAQHMVGGADEYSAACRTCYLTCQSKRV